MQVILAVMFLTAVTATSALNFCPQIQEVDWKIELLLPHRDCNKFYQCTHGQPVEMTCPKGLYYSIIESKCEWSDYVECGDRIIPDIQEPEVENEDEPETTTAIEGDEIPEEISTTAQPEILFLPNGCPVNPEEHWLLPHDTYCNLFYYCVQGEREEGRCPFWLHFNRELQICDWPRTAGCIGITEYNSKSII